MSYYGGTGEGSRTNRSSGSPPPPDPPDETTATPPDAPDPGPGQPPAEEPWEAGDKDWNREAILDRGLEGMGVDPTDAAAVDAYVMRWQEVYADYYRERAEEAFAAGDVETGLEYLNELAFLHLTVPELELGALVDIVTAAWHAAAATKHFEAGADEDGIAHLAALRHMVDDSSDVDPEAREYIRERYVEAQDSRLETMTPVEQAGLLLGEAVLDAESGDVDGAEEKVRAAHELLSTEDIDITTLLKQVLRDRAEAAERSTRALAGALQALTDLQNGYSDVADNVRTQAAAVKDGESFELRNFDAQEAVELYQESGIAVPAWLSNAAAAQAEWRENVGTDGHSNTNAPVFSISKSEATQLATVYSNKSTSVGSSIQAQAMKVQSSQNQFEEATTMESDVQRSAHDVLIGIISNIN